MKTRMKTRTVALPLFLAGIFATGPVFAGSLENLERERAHLLTSLTDASLDEESRLAQLQIQQRRLVDLERIVIRDDDIVLENTPTVRQAFANYDLTFLVHASAENNQGIIDHWLATLGLSTDTLMSARKGRR